MMELNKAIAIAEEEGQDYVPDELEGLTPRQWRIYEYLKMYCVGEGSAQKGRFIAGKLSLRFPQLFDRNMRIKDDIRAIRACRKITRQIGSNPQKGYWLALSDDKSQPFSYSLHNADVLIKNLVGQGVPKNHFFSLLTHIPDSPKATDLQGTLHVTPYEQDEIHVKSDDLNIGRSDDHR